MSFATSSQVWPSFLSVQQTWINGSSIAMLEFDYVQKVILFFVWRGEERSFLNLTDLDIPMAEFFLQTCLLLSILVIFRIKWGIKVGPIEHTLGLLCFHKNSRFLKVIQTVFYYTNILSLMKISAILDHMWRNKGPNQLPP